MEAMLGDGVRYKRENRHACRVGPSRIMIVGGAPLGGYAFSPATGSHSKLFGWSTSRMLIRSPEHNIKFSFIWQREASTIPNRFYRW